LPRSSDIAASVDGLTLTNEGAGRNRQFIRGVADSPFSGTSQSTVAIQLNDARVAYDAPDPDLRLVDVDRVEILKGPQGPLYGSGALGGVYHIVTNPPQLDRFSGLAEIHGQSVAGGDAGGGGQAVANLPVVKDRLALRAVIYREQDIGKKERPAHGGEQRLRIEKRTRIALWLIAAASLAVDWRLLVFGYLLPLAVITPLFNTVRIVLEHFDLGRGNPMWPGTFYRTGFFTRAAFLWSAGDCHVVHHFYPTIPVYRMPQALRLMRPILLREGVHEHASLVPLMADWFSAARAHWTVPKAAS